MPFSPALPFTLFSLHLFELAREVLHVLASEQQRLLPLSFARAVVVVVHCARARVYRFAPHRRHGRHKHLPPLPLAPDALHHDDGLLHGISRRRALCRATPSTKACPTAHAGAQCGSSASHRTLLVRHRSHAGRQPEVCIRVDLQLQLYKDWVELKFEFRVWEQLVSLGLVVFARFFKNKKKQKKPKRKQKKTKTKTKKKTNKAGWFIGDAVACFFLRLTYRRDRPCRDPLKGTPAGMPLP